MGWAARGGDGLASGTIPDWIAPIMTAVHHLLIFHPATQRGLTRVQARAPSVLHCTFVRVTFDMIDTKTTIAFIVGIFSGLLMAATALLPLWTAGSAIDTGSPVPESEAAPAIPAAEAVVTGVPDFRGRHHDHAAVPEPQALDELLGQQQRVGRDVGDGFDGEAADVRFGAAAAEEVLAIALVLEDDPSAYIVHGEDSRPQRRVEANE